MPTRKWLAALIAGLGTIAVMALTTDGFDKEEWIAVVGLLVERSVSYLTPNTPPLGEQDQNAGQSIVEVLVVLTLIGVVLLLAGVRF